MRKFITVISVIAACNVLVLFIYNIYPNSDNISYGFFYKIKSSQYNKVLALEIEVQDYLKQEHYKVNKLIFEDHNTQMFLKEIIADKEKIHLMIYSQIKRNLREGKFLTLRKINTRQVCDYESIAIEAKDSKGNKIPFVQYSINGDETLTINFDKEEINDLDKIYIEIKGYSLLEYRNRLL